MFTGIIETVGIISRISRVDGGAQLEIYAPDFGRDMAIGDSVAVDGACLTIAAFSRGSFVADVSLETLDRTTMSLLHAQDKVNLERAMRMSDRLGGHMVSGHVDAVGTFLQRHTSGNSTVYQFELPDYLVEYLIEKGSLSINGISLTIARVKKNMIACAVIPHTETSTTLGTLHVGDRVNVEIDMIAKYVRRFTTDFVETTGDFDDYETNESGNRLGNKLRDFLEG